MHDGEFVRERALEFVRKQRLESAISTTQPPRHAVTFFETCRFMSECACDTRVREYTCEFVHVSWSGRVEPFRVRVCV